jgi:hypothetical protein
VLVTSPAKAAEIKFNKRRIKAEEEQKEKRALTVLVNVE